jgi:DNA-binding NarL/FixJ family response regulator
VEGPPRDLHPIIRDELYRISREALRNAFRHAHARHIEAEIKYGERVLRLRIRDDGEGIPAEILKQGRPGHYGLPGIRERARQVGADLTIWSRAGTGTEIELSLAGSIAYATSPRRSRLRIFGTKVGWGVIRVLAVDDHPLLRDGIAALIDCEEDMELIGEAANGREALEMFRKHQPDITLMDLQMPEMNGMDAIGAIRGEFPDARIIILTTHPGDVQVSRALKAGARGYVLKGMLRKELLETIRAVHAGQKRLSSAAAAEIAEHAIDSDLTPREIDVLRLVAAGNANKEIGARLSLTEVTVKSHVKNILAKLGANDRTHAVTIALKRGIINL